MRPGRQLPVPVGHKVGGAQGQLVGHDCQEAAFSGQDTNDHIQRLRILKNPFYKSGCCEPNKGNPPSRRVSLIELEAANEREICC